MIKYISILVFACACFVSRAQVNIITTIAGTGEAGYDGDGGPATNAKFNRPFALRQDRFNHILICEAANHVLRKLDLSSNTATTIAGTGIPGYYGDGSNATNAKLCVPQGIAIDDADNIYISDGVNARIRKIDFSTNIITTIAGKGVAGGSGDGGLATDAELHDPGGIYSYGGYVYISDYTNMKVRRVDLATGIITTVAGNGIMGYTGNGGPATAAQLNGPVDVICDNSGNLFIAEQWSGSVRKVDILTGIISVVAGKGTLGYSGDGGPATDAEMNEPGGIFIDKHGNMFIADYRNGAVRKINGTTGIINTVAGGLAGYGGDGGPATNAKLKCTDVCVDDVGNIYIADYVNHRIRKVNNAVAVNAIDREIENKLYPNPTKGTFTIQTPLNIALVSIYNIAGMQVYERTCTAPETEIDITNQPPGVYMVYVQCGEKTYVSKIVRQ